MRQLNAALTQGETIKTLARNQNKLAPRTLIINKQPTKESSRELQRSRTFSSLANFGDQFSFSTGS